MVYTSTKRRSVRVPTDYAKSERDDDARRERERKMRPLERMCRPMHPLNDGAPLQVVRLRRADGEGTVLGVVDAARRRVWKGHDLASTPFPSSSESWEATVDVPAIPDHYGRWVKTSIGGLSETVRRVGILSANPRHRDPVTFFAIRVPEGAAEEIVRALEARGVDHAAGGVTDTGDAAYGRVFELAVYDPAQFERAAALVARAGATPLLERADVDARRAIGIERLDRIEAQIVSHDTNMEDEREDAYGVRRGRENWRFPWIPASWPRVPLTLDHMVENLLHEDIASVPQPLCQHVARRRLALGLYGRMGTAWVRSEHPPTARERAADAPTRCPYRVVLRNAPLRACLSAGRTTITEEELRAWGLEHVDSRRFLIETDDGRWYRPDPPRVQLEKRIPRQRWVACALSDAQSKQLCTCFYLLHVEGVDDAEVREAIHLVLYRYMVERGYTSRRMGKYTQDAMHIGNGDKFRGFDVLKSLSKQYLAERLPAEVLNKLCGRDGRLRNRGSKGTRSKYRTENRYRPKRRLKRSREDERAMVTAAERR